MRNGRRLRNGYAQSLTKGTQRVRTSRHGKPHVKRVFGIEEVLVSPNTPGATRRVEKIEPGFIYPAGTTITEDGLAVVWRKKERVARMVPVHEPFERMVPSGPTTKYGKKNVPPDKKVQG